MKVLIADDSLISRRLLETALQQWDYQVVAASDGIEAWQILSREDAPRLAILDWMMPGLSGPEVCRRVRHLASQRYTYILLVTSRSEREDVIQGMEAGADDYITKPFDQSELKVRLASGRRIVELQDDLLDAQVTLREQATLDALTRIWNRRSILEILDREIDRAQREKSPLSVVMGDLDHFKQINDTFGHLAGDAVLCEAVRRMKASIRSYDSLGRYGGEEFLLILPGCEAAAAERLAERMRLEIERQPLAWQTGPVPITASFGVTSLTAGVSVSAETMLRAADAALYQAKQQGRNRVVRLSAE
jgi:two-component system cell cycle response regulator